MPRWKQQVMILTLTQRYIIIPRGRMNGRAQPIRAGFLLAEKTIGMRMMCCRGMIRITQTIGEKKFMIRIQMHGIG